MAFGSTFVAFDHALGHFGWLLGNFLWRFGQHVGSLGGAWGCFGSFWSWGSLVSHIPLESLGQSLDHLCHLCLCVSLMLWLALCQHLIYDSSCEVWPGVVGGGGGAAYSLIVST